MLGSLELMRRDVFEFRAGLRGVDRGPRVEVSASVFDRSAVGHFDATVARHGEILAVSVKGALDFYSAQEARKLLLDLLEHEPSRLVIDTRFAFVDSSG